MNNRRLILSAVLAVLCAFHTGYLIGKRHEPKPAVPVDGVCISYWRTA